MKHAGEHRAGDAEKQEQQLGVQGIPPGLVERRAEVVPHEPGTGEPVPADLGSTAEAWEAAPG